ncbi:MAG: TRAP transporter TatT component family protein [Calditrichia bacterium]
MKKRMLLTTFLILLLSGCSLQKIALRSTTGLLFYGIDAIYQEPDLQLAGQAIASDLKLLEGLYLADPKNTDLLMLLTQGYASYSLGFVEDEDPARGRLFYLRARDYGFQLLQQSTEAFRDSVPEREAQFVERLANLKEEDVPALFWTAFAWGGWINLSKDNTQAVFDLNKVKAMMQRVIELDEDYFFGAAHLFFGSLAGSLPRMLGGDPEAARQHFQRALNLTDGKFMLANVYLARYYAATTLDEDLFDQYLQQVLAAPVDILPGYQLITAIAKDKALRLLASKDDLF